MNTARQIDGLAAATRLPAGPLHLAIGMFDGVHLGHRAVIDAALHSARCDDGVAGVLTFNPHPSRLFRPEAAVRLIQPPTLKAHLLFEAGVDVVITQPFDAAYAAIEAEDFVAHLRQRLPQLSALYVGENWRFGRGRRGDVALLNRTAQEAGLTVISADRINHNGAPISSTRIRGLLEEGQIKAANALLGYAYRSEGVVAAGRQLGRRLGFPTLNLGWAPELAPRFGVYAVRVRPIGAEAETALPAVANFGLRPTVENARVAPRLEVHVLASGAFAGTGWTTGTELQADWLEFLRPEQKFADLAALQTQIAKDRQTAEDFFLR